jgi:hypothetical protein
MLLEAVRNTYSSEYYRNMYEFLHDKISSNRIYSSAITEIISRKYAQGDYDKNLAITKQDTAFLMKLSQERMWHQTCMNDLASKGLDIHYDRGVQLSFRFCLAYCVPKNLVIISRYDEFATTNKEVVDALIKNMHKDSESYVEHYTDSELSGLGIETVISIILAQLSDKRLFGIEPDFKRLIDNCSDTIPVSNIIQMIPIQNKL